MLTVDDIERAQLIDRCSHDVHVPALQGYVKDTPHICQVYAVSMPLDDLADGFCRIYDRHGARWDATLAERVLADEYPDLDERARALRSSGRLTETELQAALDDPARRTSLCLRHRHSASGGHPRSIGHQSRSLDPDSDPPGT